VTGILDRLDAALQKARFRRLELRGIYLDEADYAAMVHEAKKSAVYATSGEAVVIPKRLSPRVGKPPERKCA
jgi:hypothetical protein